MRHANSSTGHLSVARAGDIVYVQAHGQCDASLGSPLKRFADQMSQEGFRRFVVDLEGAEVMDSTFMGVLLGIHLGQLEACGGGVIIANPSAHCLKLMGVLGLPRFLDVLPDSVEFPELTTTVLETGETSDQEWLALIREAHERLVAADAQNAGKFGELLSALEHEIQE
jgi:anti-anti-sigma factor